MLGRSGTSIPSVSFETGPKLVRRSHVIQEAKEEFGDRWVQEIFPSLLKQKKKWYRYKSDTKVDDIVLWKDKTAAGQTYKYVRVIKVHAGTNGKVRSF
jgi:hypothetical protein